MNGYKQIYGDGRYSIYAYRNINTGKLALYVTFPNGRGDYPIKYEDGRVAWDLLPPLRIRKIVNTIYNNGSRVYANLKDYEFLIPHVRVQSPLTNS